MSRTALATFTAVVADATQPAPRPSSDPAVVPGTASGTRTDVVVESGPDAAADRPAYDLVLISYLHLPRTDWGEALAAAVALYEAAGYRRIAPYNDNPDATAWFERRLR